MLAILYGAIGWLPKAALWPNVTLCIHTHYSHSLKPMYHQAECEQYPGVLFSSFTRNVSFL